LYISILEVKIKVFPLIVSKAQKNKAGALTFTSKKEGFWRNLGGLDLVLGFFTE